MGLFGRAVFGPFGHYAAVTLKRNILFRHCGQFNLVGMPARTVRTYLAAIAKGTADGSHFVVAKGLDDFLTVV